MDATLQVFIRNDKGKIWGPLTLSTVSLLLDNGMVEGKVQVSQDGINFAFPGRFPALRDAFPRELWGDVVVPGGPESPRAAAAPAAPAQAILLGADEPDPLMTAMAPPAGAAAMPAGAPMAGPGAQAAAQRPQGGAPMAGPGAFAAAQPRGPAAAPMAGPGAVAASSQTRAPGAARPPGPPRVTGSFPVVNAAAAAAHPAAPRPVPPVAAAPAAPRPPPAGAPPPAAAPAVAPVAPPRPAAAAAPEGPALAPNGWLSTQSAIRLYYQAASQDMNGLLTFQLDDRDIEVHFRKGNPEYVSSSHAEDALARFITRNGLASAEQVQQAEAARDRFGGELVGALFGLGILNPGTAFAQLAQRATGLLLKAFLAEDGSYTFEPKELPPHRAMPLGNRWAVLSDLVRRIPVAELKRRLSDCVDLPIMKSGGRVATTELRLTPQETRALTYIDGVRSLSQLWSDLPQEADTLARLAFMLRDMELVSFSATPVPPRAAAAAPEPPPPAPPPPAAPPPAPPPPSVAARPAGTPPQGAATVRPAGTPPQGAAAAAKPAAPAAAAAPVAGPGATAPRPAAPAAAAAPRPAGPATTGPRPVAPAAAPAPAAARPAAPAAAPKPAAPAPAPSNPEAEVEELRKQVAKLKEQNLFQVLGLDEKADGSAIKVAYFKMAKVYHPDTIPPGAPAEFAKLKGEIFAAVGDAYRTLSDDKSRAQYIEDLASGDGSGQGVDVAAILMAEELFQKGIILVKAKKFPEAIKMLDDAIKGNSEEGEFYAWRGYAKYFTYADKKQGFNEGMKDLQLCIKKNERCAPAWYFMGQLAKMAGDNNGAMRHFKKAVEINPQHVDAQRELRLLNTKK